MLRVTADDLLVYAKCLEGRELCTLYKGDRFTVGLQGDTLVFTPASTKEPRPHERIRLERVCEAFSTTNSLKPSDYHDDTVNASYTLVLIVKYLSAIADGAVKPQSPRRSDG